MAELPIDLCKSTVQVLIEYYDILGCAKNSDSRRLPAHTQPDRNL